MVVTVKGLKVASGMLDRGVGQDPGTMKFCRAVKAKSAVPPVRKGAAEGVLRWRARNQPTCSPSWARMEPRRGTLPTSSPPSVAKTTWTAGTVPRAMSVKVSASRMALGKSVTGKLYLQGATGAWPAE